MNTILKTSTDLHWLTLSMVEGHIAMWAVRQSPYHNPSGLGVVLSNFRENVRNNFDGQEMAQFCQTGIEQVIRDGLMQIEVFRSWNERKNGNKSPFAFYSRYSKPHPDNDFIDLDALIRNAAVSVIRECERDDT